MNDVEQRIRERAYRIWLEERRMSGRSRIRSLGYGLRVGRYRRWPAIDSEPIDQNLGPTGEPIEPIEAVRNAGEFSTLTDQGEADIPSRTRVSSAAGAERRGK
jgi:hypothetical protein